MIAELSPRARRATLAVICLATAMLMLDIAVVNVALPYMARDLHAGPGGLQWVADGYTLALAAVVLSAGSAADRLGRRRVFTAGLVAFTAASLTCALAGSVVLLDAARAGQGLAAALVLASSLAILADAFPAQRDRAGAMAAYGATIGFSFAVGPAMGGVLTSGLGWRAVFCINVPLGAICLAGTRRWVRESTGPRTRRLDWPGQVTSSAGLFLLVLGLLRSGAHGWGSPQTVAELAGAAGLLAAFIVIERRVGQPMLPLALFRRRDFTAAQLAALAISASFFALYLYMTLYLQDILRLSALAAGLVYMPGAVLLFAVSAASAPLTARIAPAALVGGGLVLVAAGMMLVTVIGPRSSWVAVLPGDLVSCLGTGLFNPALGMLTLSAAPRESSGLLAGVNDAFQQAGIAIGVAAFATIIPAGAALSHAQAAAYVAGLRHALFLGAAVAVTAAAVTTLLTRSLDARILNTRVPGTAAVAAKAPDPRRQADRAWRSAGPAAGQAITDQVGA
jgi:EmrB/QacA subfamily drug resistance transporter